MQNPKPLTQEQVIDAMARTATVREAAEELGISERTLYRRMEDFGIRVKRQIVLNKAA